MEPGLYLVATPIGNLEDITLRALRVLQEADTLLAEDTRHSRGLLEKHGIARRMMSYHKFNEAARCQQILELLSQGQVVALISDAGMPCISDPGARVVQAVHEAGYPVIPIPGASALTAAVAKSGLGEAGFYFGGFPPHKSGQRKKFLERCLGMGCTIALFESPYRIVKLLGELEALAPDAHVFLARELTKKFEDGVSGTPGTLMTYYAERKPRGEYVVLFDA